MWSGSSPSKDRPCQALAALAPNVGLVPSAAPFSISPSSRPKHSPPSTLTSSCLSRPCHHSSPTTRSRRRAPLRPSSPRPSSPAGIPSLPTSPSYWSSCSLGRFTRSMSTSCLWPTFKVPKARASCSGTRASLLGALPRLLFRDSGTDRRPLAIYSAERKLESSSKSSSRPTARPSHTLARWARTSS